MSPMRLTLVRLCLVPLLGLVPPGCASEEPRPKPADPVERVEPAVGPLWMVTPFEELEGWTGSDELSAETESWGQVLADAVHAQLLDRNLRQELVALGITDADARGLIARGVHYVCGGTLEAVRVTRLGRDVVGEVEVVYRLHKRVGDRDVGLVEKRRLRAQEVVSGEPTRADLRDLLQSVAAKVADRVLEDLPADVRASRGAP
jgi:hypothetical protein